MEKNKIMLKLNAKVYEKKELRKNINQISNGVIQVKKVLNPKSDHNGKN